ncbi:MAG: hypothetical protein AB3N11_18005 [Arenibacterium sp.]
MNAPILLGICAVILFGAAEASAEEKSQSPHSIACSQQPGAPLDQCSYHVERDETGKTTVTVVFANSFKRKLYFMDGKFLKANVTMSGVGKDTDWSLKDGIHMIRVERQRYEVPDILIAGE